MRIGESDPYFTYFMRRKIRVDFVNLSAKESCIVEIIFQAFKCASIDSVSFQVNSDKVSLGMNCGESDSIFTFPAGQFQSNRVFIPEKVLPSTRHSFRILKYVRERADSFESLKFFIAHVQAKIRLKPDQFLDAEEKRFSVCILPDFSAETARFLSTSPSIKRIAPKRPERF
jgi:hypothetical protein